MAQALRQMLSRRRNDKLVGFTAFHFHDAGQRIVFTSPFAFIEEKLLDLFIV
jgi:hypothetical protein